MFVIRTLGWVAHYRGEADRFSYSASIAGGERDASGNHYGYDPCISLGYGSRRKGKQGGPGKVGLRGFFGGNGF